jgi:GT2 family glycosyltransferase
MSNNADYIVLLNNDTIVAPDFLTELVNTAELNNSIGIVGSTTYYYYQHNKIQYNGGKINWWLGINNTYLCNEIDKGQYDIMIERDYVPATSCLIKREVIEKVGYLDESYFFAIEEFDYCTRVKQAGYKVIYQPLSMIWHKWMASGKKISKYPETERLIKEKVGIRAYKLWWRLYKTYSPRVWFVVPFLLQISFIGPLIVLMFKGEWGMIFKGIASRIGIKGE